MFIPLLLIRYHLLFAVHVDLNCWLKFKNSNQLSSNTWGITILHWIFDVSIIIGNHCRRHGGIGLKSKITIDSYLILEEFTWLHSIFDVLTINGNFYWKRGRIELKSKGLNFFLVNNVSGPEFVNQALGVDVMLPRSCSVLN